MGRAGTGSGLDIPSHSRGEIRRAFLTGESSGQLFPVAFFRSFAFSCRVSALTIPGPLRIAGTIANSLPAGALLYHALAPGNARASATGVPSATEDPR